jgi:hypothetical protein
VANTGASLATRNTRHFDALTIAPINPWSALYRASEQRDTPVLA